MHTLGYEFKPWIDEKSIADGPAILDYVEEAAAEHGIDQHIRFNHRATKASWSGEDAMWTVGSPRLQIESQSCALPHIRQHVDRQHSLYRGN